MLRTVNRKSVVLFFGHVTFLVLIVLAWKHADLRTTSGDSAFQTFKWVNNSGWNVEAHRYTATVPQAAVKVFKALGADLPLLLIVASVAPALLAYAVFLICLLLLKAPRSAMAAALAAVLCTRLTFYGPVLEANYLLSYPFLFMAVLEHRGLKALDLRVGVGLVLIGALTLLAHPLGWLILAFGVVLLWSLAELSWRSTLILLGSLVSGAVLVRLLFPPTAYERTQYGKLRETFSAADGDGWASWDFLVGHTFTLTNNYLPGLIVFLLLLVGLWLWKQKLAAGALAAGVLGFIGLALVTFRTGDTAIMMDRAFLPVATLIALPATYLLWELRGRWAVIASVLLVFVLFIKLRDISFGSRAPQKQLMRTEQVLEDMRKRSIAKGEINSEELQAWGLPGDWALPFGTLLISSQKAPANATTIKITRSGDLIESNGEPRIPDLESSIETMNTNYFQLPPGPYVRLAASPDAL
ncbi:MAG: hypothetical protein ABIY71_07730 [Flavobacteriales bacterium]